MSSRLHNASTIIDRQVDAGRGSRTAVIWGDERVNYAELLGRVCQFGRGLRELGVGAGDRVLVILDDSSDFPVVFLGAMRIGAVPVPVNPLYKTEDYTFFAEDSGARVVVVDGENLERVTLALRGVRSAPKLLVRGASVTGALGLADVAGGQDAELAPADTGADAAGFWLYSSGSTGRPKGVVHRHADLAETYDTYGRQVLGIREDDVTYSSSKMFHAYGLGNSITFPYSVGATAVVASGRPTPQAIMANLQKYRPSLFFCVPTLYHAVLNSEAAVGQDLGFVRACISAAEPLPAEVFARWRSAFGLEILDGIGSTEMLHIYCSNVAGDVHPGSSGRQVPGYEMRLADDQGGPVPDGEGGTMLVRGPSTFMEYWNRADRTAASIQDGWFVTGDRYRRDADGVFWYEGRADDMIKVAGLWVSPIEMENVLLQHPAVLEAAVVGIPVEGLTRVKATVVLRPEAEESPTLVADIQELCRSKLERYQYPHVVEFVDELPKTVTGKIQRFVLRTPEHHG